MILDQDGNAVIRTDMDVGEDGIIYYNKSTGKYAEYIAYEEPVEHDEFPGYMAEGYWQHVERKRMQKILDDKAYIDMPSQDSFSFFDPRQLFFGIRISFDLN